MTRKELLQALEEVEETLAREAREEAARGSVSAVSHRYIEHKVLNTPVRLVVVAIGNDEFQGDEPERFIAGRTADGYDIFVERRDIGIVSAFEMVEPILDQLNPEE